MCPTFSLYPWFDHSPTLCLLPHHFIYFLSHKYFPLFFYMIYFRFVFII